MNWHPLSRVDITWSTTAHARFQGLRRAWLFPIKRNNLISARGRLRGSEVRGTFDWYASRRLWVSPHRPARRPLPHHSVSSVWPRWARVKAVYHKCLQPHSSSFLPFCVSLSLFLFWERRSSSIITLMHCGTTAPIFYYNFTFFAIFEKKKNRWNGFNLHEITFNLAVTSCVWSVSLCGRRWSLASWQRSEINSNDHSWHS